MRKIIIKGEVYEISEEDYDKVNSNQGMARFSMDEVRGCAPSTMMEEFFGF